MTPEIRVRPEARREIVQTTDYLRRSASPAKAENWGDRVIETLQFLARNPGLGEPLNDPRVRLKGVRIGPVTKFPHYLVIYRPIEGGIEVLHVIHGARDYPSRL